MRKAKRENDLGRDPIGRLLLRLAVPTVTAQLVNALYNIVDRMYIGHIEGVGDLALTGLGVCFPVIMFVSALSALVGMGGGSRAVVRMGAGDPEGANRILGSCATLLVLLSVVFTILLQLVKEPMLLLFGATENTLPYALDYLGIYLSGTIFVELSLGLNFFITAQGFSTVGMATVLIGAVVNIVLDPILIFGFNMGVQGAALATITAQAVSAVWVVCFLMGRRTRLRLQRHFARLDWKVLSPVLALGVSPFIMQSTESLVNIAFNSSLKAYGGGLGPVVVEDGGGVHRRLGGLVVAGDPHHPAEGIDGQLHRGVGVHADGGGGGGVGQAPGGGEHRQGQGGQGGGQGPPPGGRPAPPLRQGGQGLFLQSLVGPDGPKGPPDALIHPPHLPASPAAGPGPW